MRLLNVYSGEFTWFLGESVPPYAIASHRWGDDEASYQDMLTLRQSVGLQKVGRFCEAVVSMNDRRQLPAAWKALGYASQVNWIWIDTVCIDKTNSTELSEAINSMFAWYRRATICYAYLPDVNASHGPAAAMFDFVNSEWFSRGWTLQELLAPGVVVFFSSDWTVLGHKCPYDEQLCGTLCREYGKRLNKMVSRITGIPCPVIDNWTNVSSIRVDERLTWVSDRLTSRIEDKAYCMLGICGVSMSPIYGEGDRSWTRLLRTIKAGETDAKVGRNSIMPPYPDQGLMTLDKDDDERAPAPVAVNTSIVRVMPKSLVGDRRREQIAWNATVDAEVDNRTKSNDNQKRWRERQGSAPHWTWVNVHDGNLGLVPSVTTNPTKYPDQSLKYRRSASPHRCGQLAQCGSCHGNIYTESLVTCSNRYCKSPYFHEQCVNLRKVPPEWTCLQCSRSAHTAKQKLEPGCRHPHNLGAVPRMTELLPDGVLEKVNTLNLGDDEVNHDSMLLRKGRKRPDAPGR